MIPVQDAQTQEHPAGNAVETWGREQNLRRLTGSVRAHITRALRFATAAGFREELVSPRLAVIDGKAVNRMLIMRSL
jgi:hypothetical protein